MARKEGEEGDVVVEGERSCIWLERQKVTSQTPKWVM